MAHIRVQGRTPNNRQHHVSRRRLIFDIYLDFVLLKELIKCILLELSPLNVVDGLRVINVVIFVEPVHCSLAHNKHDIAELAILHSGFRRVDL